MPVYAVDYTGSATTNRVIEIKQLSVANFRNYWVVIPDYSPFYRMGLVVKNATTDQVLVENTHYYLTHEFKEASISIGKPVFGSISFIRSAINFNIKIEYQCLGGEWSISENEILSILANMAASPRVVRWTQVTGYPVSFPSINHDVNGETDLTGLSSVVAAINQLTLAVQQRNQSTPIGPPPILLSTVNETITGTNNSKATTPLGVNTVINQKMVYLQGSIYPFIRQKINESNATIYNEALFINDALKIVSKSNNHLYQISPGTAIINNIKIVVSDVSVEAFNSYEPKVPQNLNFEETVTHEIVITFKKPVGENDVVRQLFIKRLRSYKFTNYLTYSNLPHLAQWTINYITTDPAQLEFNTAYNDSGEKVGFTLTTRGISDYIERLFFHEELTPGKPLEMQFTVEAKRDGFMAIYVGGFSHHIPIYRGRFKYRLPMIMSPTPLLRIHTYKESQADTDPYSVSISNMQIVATPWQQSFASPAELFSNLWGKTLVTVNENILKINGPANFPNVYFDKIEEVSLGVGEHVIERSMGIRKGATYKVNIVVRKAERTLIQLFAFVFNGIEQRVTIDIANGVIKEDTSFNTIVNKIGSHIYGDIVNIDALFIAPFSGISSIGIRTVLEIPGDNAVVSNFPGVASFGYYIAMFYIRESFTPNFMGDFTLSPTITNLFMHRLNINNNVITVANGNNHYGCLLTEVNDNTNSGFSIINNGFYCHRSVPVLKDTFYTFSFEAKPAGRSNIRVDFIYSQNSFNFDPSGDSVMTTFNLITSTKGVSQYSGIGESLFNGFTATIIPIANGWSRIICTFKTDPIFAKYLVFKIRLLDDNNVVNHIADATKGIYFYALNLEEGSVFHLIVPVEQGSYLDLDYIDTYDKPRSKYMIPYVNYITNHIDANNELEIQQLIGTVGHKGIGTIIDKRNAIYTKDALIKGITTHYTAIESGEYIEPNIPVICKNASTVFLKPISLLKEGDKFTIVKEIGLQVNPLIATSAVSDVMVFWDYVNNTKVTDNSVIYATNKPMEITVINGKFHVFF